MRLSFALEVQNKSGCMGFHEMWSTSSVWPPVYTVAERYSIYARIQRQSSQAQTERNDARTLLSGVHTLTALSIPTAPSRFPSQLHATWFMAPGFVIRMSLGLNAEKFGGCKQKHSRYSGKLHCEESACVREHRAPGTLCATGERVASVALGPHHPLVSLVLGRTLS